jgi:acetoacetyl-CoA synthetase|tara:strand:+ start:1519 stop:3393 length:1875 start_codon:yes stop_codon:yes gene_type:complete
LKTILYKYKEYLKSKNKLNFKSYKDLHNWSINEMSDFWKSIVDFFEIKFDKPPTSIYKFNKDFFKSQWFTDSKISYSKNIFKNENLNTPAIKYQNEIGEYVEISWNSLKRKTLEFQNILVDKGIVKGDRVVGYCSNTPELIAAFLAVNSLGAIWSCCSPDFGYDSVLDRFNQIQPKFLFYHSNYQYNGKVFSLSAKVLNLKNSIKSISSSLDLNTKSSFCKSHTDIKLSYISVDFNDPIWILFSSGTTGKPKAITHRTGGMILEHFKALALHQDVSKKDTYFWYSTTGWMMWNYSLSSLLIGSSLCIYNGSPAYPDNGVLWRLAKKAKINHFGHGAVFFQNLLSQSLKELDSFDSSYLKTIGSTGSPLFKETHLELNKIFPNTHIISLSGGTDVCTAFIGGNLDLKELPGEIQCKMLGASVEVWNEKGENLVNEMGELVLTKPFITMPVFLWNDHNNLKYKQSYFSKYDNIWNHGDWVTMTINQGIIVHGRSDSTLNRSGVRIGTSEIYSAIKDLNYVEDSLIVHIDHIKDDKLILFVKSISKLKQEGLITLIRKKCSPRHVPDLIFECPDIPYTLSGKKVEVPIKKILMGENSNDVVSKDSLKNPESLNWFVDFYENFSKSLA